MVKFIQTKIVLGTGDTPSFVSKEFFEAMHFVTSEFQFDFSLRPTTIEYRIPAFMVVEREEIYPHYSIQVSDSIEIPMCFKKQILCADTYLHKTAKSNFDRFRVLTEKCDDAYYLLVPHAQYFDTCIYKDWTIRHVVFDSIHWEIHFKQVYVDPHDTKYTVWFYSHPKYRVEMIARYDFREEHKRLKASVMSMLPRSFR
jgi:hypothetical protein